MVPTDFTRWAAPAGMIGGLLWAITPLRDTVFGGGGTPDHPVFRPYNAAVIVIALLLLAGLAGLRAGYGGAYGRPGGAGVAVVFAGYVLLLAGSVPAVFLDPVTASGTIRAGQDLGFLGALVAGLGAVVLGGALWRTPAPRTAALLLVVSLPLGLAGVILLQSIGLVSPAGLAITVPYGTAWVVLGIHLRPAPGRTVDGTSPESADREGRPSPPAADA